MYGHSTVYTTTRSSAHHDHKLQAPVSPYSGRLKDCPALYTLILRLSSELKGCHCTGKLPRGTVSDIISLIP